MPPFIDSAEQLDNCPTKSSGYADRDRHFIGDTRHGLKAMTNYMTEYYRCPSRYAQFSIGREMSEASGYFCFDGNTVYGRCSGLQPAKAPTDPLSNADQGVRCENGTLDFPFDLTQVIDNLR